MKDANDAQLKIYLYLLRMLQAREPVDPADIADQFNHTEKDVMRSLCYWEKRGLLALEYGPDKSLSSIRLLPFPSVSGQTSGLPKAQAAPAEETGAAFAKPAYSLDQLKAFREQENTAQLVFIAEQYLARTLSPADLKSLLFFSDVLRFSDDLIDYLLQYCVERGKKDFRYIEKVAIGWAEAGVKTPAEAEGHASRYDRSVYAVMNALGKTNAPAKNEVAYIRRWTKEYGFETDVILEACARTVLATDRHRFAYADKILAAWHKAGVHHLSDIAGLDASFHKEKAEKPPRGGAAAAYNRFMHSAYDFNALEEELLKK